MMTEGLVGCAGHVADPREGYKQCKNRCLSSGKIICRTAAVSVAIELCKEEMILLIPPENM